MTPRRRGYMLIEMLAVLIAVTVGGSLITAGILSIRRSQDRLAEFANRTALLNDFVQCLRRDVRAATAVRLREGDGEGSPRVLELSDASKHVTYLFDEQRVERVGSGDRAAAAKVWDPMMATVSVRGLDGEARRAVVSATVYWYRVKGDVPQPDRRFDFTVRCAGELYHETD